MPDQSYRDTYDELATLRQEMAEAEARGYQRAIDELLKVPSHETHVAADWLEAQRHGRAPEFGHTECAAEAAEADVRRLVDQLAEANSRLIDAREQRDRWRRMHHAERERLQRSADSWQETARLYATNAADAQAERDGMRPVVEAAKAWVAAHASMFFHGCADFADQRVHDALDAFDDVVSAPLISADEATSPQSGGNESELRQAPPPGSCSSSTTALTGSSSVVPSRRCDGCWTEVGSETP
jgi:hypothetical protein